MTNNTETNSTDNPTGATVADQDGATSLTVRTEIVSRAGRRARISVRALLATAVAAVTLAGGFAVQPATAEVGRAPARSEPGSSSGSLPLSNERYAGPYQDLSGIRPTTLSELIRLGDRRGAERPLDLGVAPDTGVDPPYDPGKELQELMAPWNPPGSGGPGTASPAPPPPPPTGPGGFSNPPPPPPPPLDRVPPAGPGCIGGKFVYKSKDGGPWLPGAFWTVRVWLRSDDQKTFFEAASSPIELDSLGEWQFCPADLTEMNHQLLYSYEATNQMFTLKDFKSPKNTPFWGSPFNVNPSYPPNAGIYPNAPYAPYVTDPGATLKTDTVDTGIADFWVNPNFVYAVPDIFRWSMEALITARVNNIDLRRPSPNQHNIMYPYTSGGGCKTSRGSCYVHSLPSSPAYIGFASDQVKPDVVHHELGHSLAAQYRGGGVGGDHVGSQCTASPELAYSEGFANFFAEWVQHPDVSLDAGNIEEPSANCNIEEDGTTSEWWIAGALWDLHDQNVDGYDTSGITSSKSYLMKLFLLEPNFQGSPVDTVVKFRNQFLSKFPEGAKSKVWAEYVFWQNLIP